MNRLRYFMLAGAAMVAGCSPSMGVTTPAGSPYEIRLVASEGRPSERSVYHITDRRIGKTHVMAEGPRGWIKIDEFTATPAPAKATQE